MRTQLTQAVNRLAVLAGPILRRLSPTRFTLWLATRAPVEARLALTPTDGQRSTREFELSGESRRRSAQLRREIRRDGGSGSAAGPERPGGPKAARG